MRRRYFLASLLGTAVVPSAVFVSQVRPPAPFFGVDLAAPNSESFSVWLKYLPNGVTKILWEEPSEGGWLEAVGVVTHRRTNSDGSVNTRWYIKNK